MEEPPVVDDDLCAEVCLVNENGVDCYDDCAACGEGVDRCPQDCMEGCDDCACCHCEISDEMDRDFSCTLAAEISKVTGYSCEASKGYEVPEEK
jgi:hypothetical protein